MIYLEQSFERPVLVLGAGCQSNRELIIDEATNLGWPIALTWGAIDMLPSSHPLNLGGFGTHALRAPNFAIQNADFLLTVGTRLDTKSTGTPLETFARAATIWMVDIDEAEIAKFGNRVVGWKMDALRFLREFRPKKRPLDSWWTHIRQWQQRWPIPENGPYEHIRALSDEFKEGDIIVSDTGHALAWMMQAFRFKEGQRFIHAFNNTPMGYGLPAAIGAAFANPGKEIRLITGDGGLQLNIQEMGTVEHHKLPITIYLFNNHSHGMCVQTQRQWMGSVYPSTSMDGGYHCPNLAKIAQAYGVNLVEFEIPFGEELTPCVVAWHPNEDAYPYLSKEELKNQMLIPLWEKS